MKKLSQNIFRKISIFLISCCITSLVGTLLFYGMGYTFEYYHISSPVELYGSFGWFAFAWYLLHFMIFSMTAFMILLLIGSKIFDLGEHHDKQN